MDKAIFKSIPKDNKLIAIGNFYRNIKGLTPWSLGVLFESVDGGLEKLNVGLEATCILGVGRCFTQDKDAPYQRNGFTKEFVLPRMETWREDVLTNCSRFSKYKAGAKEYLQQKNFVFDCNGLKVWLPKFELARKLFFHAGVLARAAFEPNGLDMLFSIDRSVPGEIHGYTPDKTGVSAKLLKKRAYQDFFNWLLLNQDARHSYESIWQNLNSQQTNTDRYARWYFDFVPPAILSNLHVMANGAFDAASNEFLVWELTALHGLNIGISEKVKYHHSIFKKSVRSEQGGKALSVRGSGNGEVEVDVDSEPTDSKERVLINFPCEGLTFTNVPSTSIAYDGAKNTLYGLKGEDASDEGSTPLLLGIGESSLNGDIASGELQKLSNDETIENPLKTHFNDLQNLLKGVAKELDISEPEIQILPLPSVKRCSMHLLSCGSSRRYLVAKFALKNGRSRYFLEIDTSDQKKKLSSRVIEFVSGLDEHKELQLLMRRLVKQSLSWPERKMKEVCSLVCSIRHPNGDTSQSLKERKERWIGRINAVLQE